MNSSFFEKGMVHKLVLNVQKVTIMRHCGFTFLGIILANYQCLRRVLSIQKAAEYRIWLVNKSNMDQHKEASDKINVW